MVINKMLAVSALILFSGIAVQASDCSGKELKLLAKHKAGEAQQPQEEKAGRPGKQFDRAQFNLLFWKVMSAGAKREALRRKSW
jgi:hypothetical protein